MTAFTDTNMGIGISAPIGVDTSVEYPLKSGNNHADSLDAYLSDWADAIAKENGLSLTENGDKQDVARRVPELWGEWNTIGESGRYFLTDSEAFVLRKRGMTPVIHLQAPPNYPMFDGTAYQGADLQSPPSDFDASDGRFLDLETNFGSDFLGDWDTSDRNWAQRVLDGDYDTWLTDFADRIADFTDLTADGTDYLYDNANIETSESTSATGKYNRKGYDVDAASDYDKVIVRLAFEPNGSLKHSIGDITNSTEFARARDEYVMAWAYIAGFVKDIAPNAYFFMCYSYQSTSTDTEPRNHSAVEGIAASGNYGWAIWNNALQDYVDYLGTDLYDGKGEGTRHGKSQSDPSGSGSLDGGVLIHNNGDESSSFSHLKAIFEYYGESQIPLMIGEFGSTLTPKNGRTGSPPAQERPHNCSSIDTDASWNDQCRGHFLKNTADELNSTRGSGGGGWRVMRALKGMLYFNIDMWTEGLTEDLTTLRSAEPFDAIWALASEHALGGGDPAKPLTGDYTSQTTWPAGMDNGSDSERYWVPLNNANPPTKQEPRPTLVQAAAGTWVGNSSSDNANNFALKRFCHWWDQGAYGATFRGHGGTIFSEMSPV